MKLAIALLLLLSASLATAQGKFHETYRKRIRLNVLALSPDGKQVITDDGTTTQLLTLETGATRKILPGGIQAGNFVFVPDGKSIYYNRAGAAQTWVRETHWLSLVDGATKQISTGEYGLQVSPDGKRLARVGKDGLIVSAADGSGGSKIAGKVFRIVYAWSPDGETLVLGRIINRELHLFTLSLRDGVERDLTFLEPFNGTFDSKLVWPMAQDAYVLRPAPKWHATSQVWHFSMQDGKLSAVTDDADGFVTLVGTSADGETLAVIRQVDEGTFFDGLLNILTPFYNPDRFQHDLVILHK